MKTLAVTILIALISCTGSAQIIIQAAATKKPAVVEMKSGDVKTGFVYDFIDRRGVSVSAGQWESGDSRANLTDASFVFEGTNGTREKIKSEDASVVTITKENGEKVKYIRVGIQKVKGSGDIRVLDRKLWLPIINDEGTIKVLGYRLYENGFYGGSNLYFFREGDEFVTKILDYTNVNSINMFSIHKRARNAMRTFFQDCEAATAYLDTQEENGGLMAHVKAVRKEARKTKKEVKKLPRAERTAIHANQREEELIGYYVKALNFYNNNCSK